MSALLTVRDLAVRYRVPSEGLLSRARSFSALDGVSFELAAGETLGVVGESGCGKSTLARAILGLVPAAAGAVAWQGQDIARLDRRALKALRRDLQIVFQDPLGALDPRMTAGQTIAEPVVTHEPALGRAAIAARVAEAMQRVGLDPLHLNRYPHEFSGGQCQRIAIARATVLAPKLVVCDEPVSALDVSIQAQIVNLLVRLQDEGGLALIFISHNLTVVRHVSHRIAVLYLGRLIELGPAAQLYAAPRHPYTKALIAALPIADPDRERARPPRTLAGELPSALAPPSGCAFRTRCPHAIERCAVERPMLEPILETGGAQAVACHRWRDLA
ncbi:MAG: ATP-binding cassette domain-containing protein [Alphaproteobacteria bacterium]|nr:ATP-binding cassette domain-containing protein [Alphaproteobacteria bacterium]